MAKVKDQWTLNEKQFVDYLANLNPDYHRYEYQDFMDTFVRGLQEVLSSGKDVRFHSLGTFKVVIGVERKIINPVEGKTFIAPPRPNIKFKYANVFTKEFKVNILNSKNPSLIPYLQNDPYGVNGAKYEINMAKP